MRAKRIAIGDNYFDGAEVPWEEINGDGGLIDYLADLVVEGNVGIGTVNPNTALDLNGAFSVHGISVPSISPSGQGRIYFDSTANKFKVSENAGTYSNLVGGGGGGTEISTSCAWYAGSVGSCTPPACPAGWLLLGTGNVPTNGWQGPSFVGYSENICYSSAKYDVISLKCGWGYAGSISSCNPAACPATWTDLGVSNKVATVLINGPTLCGYSERLCYK